MHVIALVIITNIFLSVTCVNSIAIQKKKTKSKVKKPNNLFLPESESKEETGKTKNSTKISTPKKTSYLKKKKFSSLENKQTLDPFSLKGEHVSIQWNKFPFRKRFLTTNLHKKSSRRRGGDRSIERGGGGLLSGSSSSLDAERDIWASPAHTHTRTVTDGFPLFDRHSETGTHPRWAEAAPRESSIHPSVRPSVRFSTRCGGSRVHGRTRRR